MTQTLFLGTYTKKDSKGIYSIELNQDSKELVHLKQEVQIGNPTYIDGDKWYSYLYSVEKTDDGKGGIASFKQNASGEFEKVDDYLEEGAPPCYVAYDNDKQLIYTANYHKGEVAVLKSSDSGSLSLVDKVTHSGQSVHENQTSPHAHYFDLTPDKQFLVACDLGTDEVYTYRLTNDHLEEVSVFKAAPGSGPRHLAFHPNGKIAYLFAELSSDVITLSYDAETGAFTHLQTISSIPAEHTDFNGGAAIRVTSDGRFVYASNRGHDSLAIYTVKEDGTLDLSEYVSTEGETPRDFNLDPTEQFVVVGHQDSDNLTLFERNTDNGSLSLLQKDIYAPEVICIKFAEKL
ncbi:lactonase family protein [Alkalibacterium olivapovliticus]|uniref:6-phosphogluconolactonase n=1 Tax=Alkalibacterium olivapovliticus TaxID=99907 RepID=A0A2T0W6I6_9LACT|nr:lactonase family protein [Alkalibacterium olivapovliticus]PRY82114.1 6-phosphogluconolactonase [Alkalibacterium olivapovliticus]